MIRAGLTAEMAGLHPHCMGYNPLKTHWQCSGCGVVFGNGHLACARQGELYGDEKHQPIVVPALPDGKYRMFCEGCCSRCSACRQTVYRKQCDGSVCLGCAKPTAAAVAAASASAAPPPPQAVKKRLVNATLGAMLARMAPKATPAAPTARVIITGDPVGYDEATRIQITGPMYQVIRNVALTTITDTFKLNPSSVTLIGNGMMWCDHVAMDLFANATAQFKGLEIYPSSFDATAAVKFGALAFGCKTARCDHEDLAVKKGMKSHVGEKRPVMSAATSATHIIAFTWSPSDRFIVNPAWGAWCASRPVGKRGTNAVHHSLYDMFGIKRPVFRHK